MTFFLFNIFNKDNILYTAPLEMGGHTANIKHTIYNTDGRLIFSSSDDNTIRVWDVASAKVGFASNQKFFPLELCVEVILKWSDIISFHDWFGRSGSVIA